MEIKTCSEHMTHEQKEKIDHRSIEEKRHWLKIGQMVIATSEYRKIFSTDTPDFENGKIVEFKDPWDWEGKTASSVAYIEMPCGCVKYISTGWLRGK